jgi:hypothetical protein
VKILFEGKEVEKAEPKDQKKPDAPPNPQPQPPQK